jgi:23S rRNA (uracil1939-C5)-methyltransferase
MTLGYLKAGSWEQISINRCQIADTDLNLFISDLLKIRLQLLPQKFRLDLQIWPALREEQKPFITCVFHPLSDMTLTSLISEISRHRAVLWVGSYKESAPIFVHERWEQLLYHSSPGLFQQVNLKENHKVRSLVKNYVKKHNCRSILDLFCGSGNLSLALLKDTQEIHVTGVESNPKAIAVAKENVKINQLQNGTFFAQPVDRYLIENKNKAKAFWDLVLIDPPRAGMSREGLDLLIQMRPKRILYLSCDPMTLGRDLQRLSSLYTLTAINGFDFFPQSYHIESLIQLNLK